MQEEDSGIEKELVVVSQAVLVAQQGQNEGLPVSRPRQPGVGAGVGTKVDEEQPAPIVLQGPGVGVKVDVGQTVSVLQLQGQAANVPNLQLTLQWLQQVSAYSR